MNLLILGPVSVRFLFSFFASLNSASDPVVVVVFDVELVRRRICGRIAVRLEKRFFSRVHATL